MKIKIVNKRKYRWEYLYILGPLFILWAIGFIDSFSLNTGLVVGWIFIIISEINGLFGYKNVGQITILDSSIAIVTKNKTEILIELKEGHKIIVLDNMHEDNAFNQYSFTRLILLDNSNEIINIELMLSKNDKRQFNYYLDLWSRNNYLIKRKIST